MKTFCYALTTKLGCGDVEKENTALRICKTGLWGYMMNNKRNTGLPVPTVLSGAYLNNSGCVPNLSRMRVSLSMR